MYNIQKKFRFVEHLINYRFNFYIKNAILITFEMSMISILICLSCVVFVSAKYETSIYN